MKSNSLLIICTHGTYGNNDDVYGALLTSNVSLAKGLKVTLYLTEQGVFICKKNQNPMKIGLPNNFNEINDFIDLGGRLLVDENSMEERGIDKSEIIEGAEIINIKDLDGIIKEHQVSITF